MALSRYEIDKVDAHTKEEIASLNTKIVDAENLLNSLGTELEAFTNMTKSQIACQTDMSMQYVFQKGSLPKLNLVQLRNKVDDLNNRILRRREDITKMKISQSQLTGSLRTKVRQKIIDAIYASIFLKGLECPICYKVKPPVRLKFPCHASKNDTGRPACWKSVCLTCARNIAGLSYSVNRPTTVKCPWCPTTCVRFPNGIAAYELNMQWIAAVDDCLAEEDLEFRKFFGLPLNPISCPECKNSLAGISDLHHHMRGDEGFTACPESMVTCKNCKSISARHLLSVHGLCDICQTSIGYDSNTNLGNVWNEPVPVADQSHW